MIADEGVLVVNRTICDPENMDKGDHRPVGHAASKNRISCRKKIVHRGSCGVYQMIAVIICGHAQAVLAP